MRVGRAGHEIVYPLGGIAPLTQRMSRLAFFLHLFGFPAIGAKFEAGFFLLSFEQGAPDP